MAKETPLHVPEYLGCIDEVDLGAAEEDGEGKEPGGFGELVFYMWDFFGSGSTGMTSSTK
jgi:hypothetical protein